MLLWIGVLVQLSEKLLLVRLAEIEIDWLRSRPFEAEQVHSFVEVVNIISIDPAAFEFRLQLSLLMSWTDSRIEYPCGNFETQTVQPFCEY